MEWPHCQPAPSLDKQLKPITGFYGVLVIKVGVKVLPFPPPPKKKNEIITIPPTHPPSTSTKTNPRKQIYRKCCPLTPLAFQSQKWLRKISEKTSLTSPAKADYSKVLRSHPPNWTTPSFHQTVCTYLTGSCPSQQGNNNSLPTIH